MTYPLQFYDETIQVEPVRSHYMDNDTLALMLYTTDGEPFATLTVNLDESDALRSKYLAFVDTNNHPWAPKFLAESKLGKPVGTYGFSGFCAYPLYRFNVKGVKHLD